MKKSVFYTLLFVLGIAYPAIGKLVYMDLSDAIKNKMIKLDAVNMEGQYCGKTTKLFITNTSETTLQLKINLGVILQPDNPSYQPLVLTGEEVVMVQPAKTKETDVYTFCGNSPMSCPGKGSHYSFSGVGSEGLIQVLRFIKTNSVFNYLGQDAVWVMTNEHSIGTVYSSDNEAMGQQLRDLLCKTTKQHKPEYFTMRSHVQRPDEPAFVPKTLKIIANFEVLLDSPKVLTLGVFDSSGKMIQSVFENQSFQRAGHRFGVEFESENVPAGKYYIWLKEGERIVKEKMVKVD